MKKARKLPMQLVAFRLPKPLLDKVKAICDTPREMSQLYRDAVEAWVDKELDRE
jgi:hypothetical protein